ncbi:hypothetical protein [Gemmata sp.]|uniref:hypothetical protein n=1 Tax=Gemmata sp. TaxID=1914242 RepID=UPI003F72BF2B
MDIRWRLDRLIEAQIGAGREMGLRERTAYILVAAFLNDADLVTIKPFLTARSSELPALGEEGEYRGAVVFRLDSPRRAELPPNGWYKRIAFCYAPMLHVFRS